MMTIDQAMAVYELTVVIRKEDVRHDSWDTRIDVSEMPLIHLAPTDRVFDVFWLQFHNLVIAVLDQLTSHIDIENIAITEAPEGLAFSAITT